ncbi:protein of unknown function [Burkholderia multivorans]
MADARCGRDRPRPLSPEVAVRDEGRDRAARQARRAVDAARHRMLRDGRIVRLRRRALRPVDEDRRKQAAAARAKGAGGRDRRDQRVQLPRADRTGRGQDAAAHRTAREARARRQVRRSVRVRAGWPTVALPDLMTKAQHLIPRYRLMRQYWLLTIASNRSR